MTFTAAEKAAAAEHEAKMRRAVFLKWVEQRRHGWTRARAEREIALMDAIAADYRAQAEAEKPRTLL